MKKILMYIVGFLLGIVAFFGGDRTRRRERSASEHWLTRAAVSGRLQCPSGHRGRGSHPHRNGECNGVWGGDAERHDRQTTRPLAQRGQLPPRTTRHRAQQKVSWHSGARFLRHHSDHIGTTQDSRRAERNDDFDATTQTRMDNSCRVEPVRHAPRWSVVRIQVAGPRGGQPAGRSARSRGRGDLLPDPQRGLAKRGLLGAGYGLCARSMRPMPR